MIVSNQPKPIKPKAFQYLTLNSGDECQGTSSEPSPGTRARKSGFSSLARKMVPVTRYNQNHSEGSSAEKKTCETVPPNNKFMELSVPNTNEE